MSEYQIARVPKLKLRSLSAIREKLETKKLSFSQSNFEYLTSQERVQSLGDSIGDHFSKPHKKIHEKAVNNSTENLNKIVSLWEALTEKKHSLLKSMVSDSLTSKETQMLNRAVTIMKSGTISTHSTMQSEAGNLLHKLSDTVKTAHLQLSNIEKEVITEKTMESLSSLGYSTVVKSVGSEMLIRGTRKDLSIAAQITEKGELNIDMAGFVAGECTDKLRELNEKLSKQGIEIDVIGGAHHEKREGGLIIQKINRAEAFNPLASMSDNKSKSARHVQKMAILNKLMQRIHR